MTYPPCFPFQWPPIPSSAHTVVGHLPPTTIKCQWRDTALPLFQVASAYLVGLLSPFLRLSSSALELLISWLYSSLPLSLNFSRSLSSISIPSLLTPHYLDTHNDIRLTNTLCICPHLWRLVCTSHSEASKGMSPLPCPTTSQIQQIQTQTPHLLPHHSIRKHVPPPAFFFPSSDSIIHLVMTLEICIWPSLLPPVELIKVHLLSASWVLSHHRHFYFHHLSPYLVLTVFYWCWDIFISLLAYAVPSPIHPQLFGC